MGAGKYIKKHYGTELRTQKKLRDHFQDEMFTGYDTDQTMLRITAMNTILHGMDNADIRFNDSLSKNNTDADKYTLVFANPPFKGSLDNDAVAANLTSKVDTKKTELLFVALFLRMLDAGGRCACIVPDGVLFGASKAHKDLRKELVDNNKLTAVISMPSGVFKPYAGVSTAILIFTKTGTGGTDDVWFYDMKSDGYTLDDKRDKLPGNGDLDDIVARFENLDAEKERSRTDQSFMVSAEEIRKNGYDLSININPKVRVWCSEPKKIASEGDILLSVRAPIGALNMANQNCCIGRGLAALTANDGICNKEYLWYALKSRVDKLVSKGTGSTFKAIGKDILKNLSIPLPILSEQVRIAERLQNIDCAIDICEKLSLYLDELVKSRFIELFGDPVTNPRGWEKVPLSDLAEIRIGPFGTLLHKEDYIEGGHPLVNPSHIHDGNIVTDDKLTISDEKYEELSAYHLFENDVVMGRRGEMGRCAVVPTSGLLCGTGSMIIRSFGEVRPDFLQKIISFPSFKKTIEDMAVGQTMPNLNVPIVSRLEIIKPPSDVQDAYYDFVALADKSESVIRELLEKHELMKAALMQQYFG